MKKSLRVISALLLAVMLGAVIAAPASAGFIFVQEESAKLVPNSPKAYEEKNPPYAPGCTVYKAEPCTYTSVLQLPDCSPSCGWGWTRPYAGQILCGGKYYSADDGRVKVNDYMSCNSYNLTLLVGEQRSFCDGAYYYSTDPSVCYFDYSTGKLVAAKYGAATVYVYTKGGVPITGINVDVRRQFPGETNPDTLIVTPTIWNPAVGNVVDFCAKSSCGKAYNDIMFKIVNGWDRACIGENNGKLNADRPGTVIVRAYSKSNPKVFGDAFVYIGGYTASVYEGGWKTCNGGICVNSWGYDVYDVCGSFGSCVSGWIGVDNCYLPVIHVYDAYAVNPGAQTSPSFCKSTVYGNPCKLYTSPWCLSSTPSCPTSKPAGTTSTPDTWILVGDTISYLDLLRLAYGNTSTCASIIGLYNNGKYGYPGIYYNQYDYRTVLLASILGLLK
jgi:hypothetical protein